MSLNAGGTDGWRLTGARSRPRQDQRLTHPGTSATLTGRVHVPNVRDSGAGGTSGAAFPYPSESAACRMIDQPPTTA